MLIAALFAALAAAMSLDCGYDKAALLALDQDAFDQDLKGGWRAVANRPGCELVAADLLRDYRLAHPEIRDPSILFWHEGQARAMAGDARAAVPLLEQARRPPDDDSGWNPYVDATVAFLNDDKTNLDAARRALAAVPAPPGWAKTAADAEAMHGRPVRWPLNLDVVDGLRACFGKPYREAYSDACRKLGAGAEIR